MITATSMLDWSQSWMNVAEDGFKAEMIWLAAINKLTNHPAVNGLIFTTPEWQYFAFQEMPQVYKNPNRKNAYNRAYDQMQSDAVFNMSAVNDILNFPLQTGDNLNLVVHKVIWSSQFGKRRPVMVDAQQILLDSLNTADDDVYAKSVVALQILGTTVNATRTDQILSATTTVPQTYHAQLCSLITKGLA